jgi:hypothetical protein
LSGKSQEERSGLVRLPSGAVVEEVGERRVSGNSELEMGLAWEVDFRVMVAPPE